MVSDMFYTENIFKRGLLQKMSKPLSFLYSLLFSDRTNRVPGSEERKLSPLEILATNQNSMSGLTSAGSPLNLGERYGEIKTNTLFASRDLNKKMTEYDRCQVDDKMFETVEKLTKSLSERETEIVRDKNRWIHTFNSVPDIMMIVNKDRKIIQVNDSFVNATRITREKALSMKCYDIITGSTHTCSFCPEDDIKKKSCFLSHANKFETISIDNEYLTGTFLFSSTKIKYDDVDQHSSVVMLRDVTKIKETELNLSKKERTIECLSKIGSYLIQNIGWSDAVSLVLQQLVDGMNVDFSAVLRREKPKSRILQITDYYSNIPIDPVSINACLRSGIGQDFVDKFEINSSSLRTPIIRTDLFKKEQLKDLESIGLFGLVCVPLVIDGFYWGVIIIGCKDIPEGGFSEVDVRTLRTVANLMCSFLVKQRMDQLLNMKDVYFRTILDDHAAEYAFRLGSSKLEITYATKAFCTLLGQNLGDVVGKKIGDVFLDNSIYVSEFVNAMKTELSIENPTICRVFSIRNEGNIEKHQQILRVIYDEDGNVSEYQCVGRKL